MRLLLTDSKQVRSDTFVMLAAVWSVSRQLTNLLNPQGLCTDTFLCENTEYPVEDTICCVGMAKLFVTSQTVYHKAQGSERLCVGVCYRDQRHIRSCYVMLYASRIV